MLLQMFTRMPTRSYGDAGRAVGVKAVTKIICKTNDQNMATVDPKAEGLSSLTSYHLKANVAVL